MIHFTALDDSLRNFIERWVDHGIETNSAFSISVDEASLEDLNEIVSDVENLSEQVDSDVLVLRVTGREDGYRIRYNPNNSSIQSERDLGEYDIETQYSYNEELIETLQKIESDSLSDPEELRNSLEIIAQTDDLDVGFDYNLQKERIIDEIAGRVSADDLTIKFHFFLSNFSTRIEETPPHKIREYLLDDGDEKTLIVILGFDSCAKGSDFAISGMKELEPDASFFSSRAQWTSEFEKIRSQTMIEDPDSNFLPPSFFRFDSLPESEDISDIRGLFSKFIALFVILSIFNSSERIDSAKWKIRMTGRQYIEGIVSISGDSDIYIYSDEEALRIENTQYLVEDLYSIYEWVYLVGDEENRIGVFRNVATLFSRSVEDFLENTGKILGSAKANRQYFLEQSIDDFFEFRQELMEGAFRTQRTFSELRSALMQDFTRDLFRTFGFILILSVTIFFNLDTILPITLVYNLLAILVFVYGLITLRRIGGIRRNFNTIIENRNNFVEFYGRFLDEEEMREIGVDQSSEASWFCKFVLSKPEDRANIQMRCGFAIDFLLYYLLAVVVILGSILILVDINIIDLIPQIPPE